MWFKKREKEAVEVKEKRCAGCGASCIDGSCAVGFKTTTRTIKIIENGYVFEKTIYLPARGCLGPMSFDQAWNYRKLGRVTGKI